MHDYFLKLQKRIFELSVFAAAFLGFSLAYLLGVLLTFFLQRDFAAGILPQTSAAPSRALGRGMGQTFRTIEEFQGLVAGNLLRDHSNPVSGERADQGTAAVGGREILLYGVVAGSPSFASAAIQIVGEKDVNEYFIGQEVAGYKLIDILGDSIVLKLGENKLKLLVGEKTGFASGAQMNGAAPPSIAGAQKVTVSRDRLVAISQDQTELYKNKFAPITRNGKILGFKLLYVPTDNFLYQLGARSGDIIRRFNGQPLETAEKMFEMWQSLKTATRVSIEVERGGKIVPFEIDIQN